MFDLLRIGRGKRNHSPRQMARERVQAAIRRDRLEVSTPQLSQLRVTLLSTINEHLPVAAGVRRVWVAPGWRGIVSCVEGQYGESPLEVSCQ